MEIAGFSFEVLFFLFSIAVLAGFLDTLAGGGGLLSLPALIISGVPPLAALGTNKLQGSVGTATASLMMIRKRKVSFNQVKQLMMAAFLGSALGSIAVQFINTELLDYVIPFVLILISFYFLFSPSLAGNTESRISTGLYRSFVVPVIGWYDGMFGPGTGSFFALAGVSLKGQSLLNATVVAKTLNFSTNFASLLVFLVAGQVVWIIGLLMMLGQLIGAWLGSHMLFKINIQMLRLLVVTMCFGMLIKYSFSMEWL